MTLILYPPSPGSDDVAAAQPIAAQIAAAEGKTVCVAAAAAHSGVRMCMSARACVPVCSQVDRTFHYNQHLFGPVANTGRF